MTLLYTLVQGLCHPMIWDIIIYIPVNGVHGNEQKFTGN